MPQAAQGLGCALPAAYRRQASPQPIEEIGLTGFLLLSLMQGKCMVFNNMKEIAPATKS